MKKNEILKGLYSESLLWFFLRVCLTLTDENTNINYPVDMYCIKYIYSIVHKSIDNKIKIISNKQYNNKLNLSGVKSHVNMSKSKKQQNSF